MIAPPSGVRVLVATKPIDFRKGANGLTALVKDHLYADPFSGVIYVFRAKRADRIKLLYWVGTGVVLIAKTLEQGVFRWPRVQGGVMRSSMRRFTRLTNAFSKKLDNHIHALALYFAFYNFYRIHKKLKISPAMAAGISDRLLSLEDIADRIEARQDKPMKRGRYKKRVANI